MFFSLFLSIQLINCFEKIWLKFEIENCQLFLKVKVFFQF